MPIFLLRHGESAHNIAIKSFMDSNPDTHVLEWFEIEDAFDPKIRDADLTEKGRAQAQQVRQEVNALNPSLLIMSPLTRNLRTGLESCADLLNTDDSNLQIKITPDLREHTYSTCDLGSPVDSLQAAFPLWSGHLSNLSSDWWCHDEDPVDSSCRMSCREPWQKLQDRVEELTKMIKQCQEDHETIVVVGHAVLFYALTGEWLSNCQLMELDLNKLRARCECVRPACCCDNPGFDPTEHT
mmetsp:Transcript_20874/g.35178  ORF Transcript_20874/g.35178 Transcript_20874/m.35178 type:complete len:240 (-) Transcript_20874:1958-2677(-)